jgi:hypothetical protein
MIWTVIYPKNIFKSITIVKRAANQLFVASALNVVAIKRRRSEIAGIQDAPYTTGGTRAKILRDSSLDKAGKK